MSRSGLFLALLLIGGPAFAINDAQLDAVLKECKQGRVCPCPPSKIANVDKSACGPEPKDYVDAQGNWHGKALEKYNKCLSELMDENNKITAYNNIFASCQRPHASNEKTKFTNLPPRPVYSGEGKTLNEQVQDVKAAELAQEQALREEEAARRAEQDRAFAAAHRPVEPAQPAQQSQPQPTAQTCFRNSRYGMNVATDPQNPSPNFFVVCLDQSKSAHWADGALGETPNGDGLATAGPHEFARLMQSCLRTPVEYSCPECCQPVR